MIGSDLKKLAKDNPAIARATATVNVINQAANLLRRFRIDSNQSQTEMADKLGVSQPRIAQLESGKPGSAPSLEQIADYAHYTGNTVSICDSAQTCSASERDELLGEIKRLKAAVRELEAEKEARSKAKSRKYGIGEIRDINVGFPTMHIPGVALHVQRSNAPRAGDTVVVPVALDLSDPHQNQGLPLKERRSHLIGSGEAIVIGSKENVNVSDITEQWNRIVSKVELRKIAQLIEQTAKEQRTRAYDIFAIVTSLIDIKFRP